MFHVTVGSTSRRRLQNHGVTYKIERGGINETAVSREAEAIINCALLTTPSSEHQGKRNTMVNPDEDCEEDSREDAPVSAAVSNPGSGERENVWGNICHVILTFLNRQPFHYVV